MRFSYVFSLYLVIVSGTMKDSKTILTEIDTKHTGRIFLNAI